MKLKSKIKEILKIVDEFNKDLVDYKVEYLEKSFEKTNIDYLELLKADILFSIKYFKLDNLEETMVVKEEILKNIKEFNFGFNQLLIESKIKVINNMIVSKDLSEIISLKSISIKKEIENEIEKIGDDEEKLEKFKNYLEKISR